MEKELDQLLEKESYNVKYISELREYWNAYSYALINEIYVGVAINLGMSEKDAYSLARNRPGELQKAGFFKSIFDKFKNVFKHKVPKFRYKQKIYGDGKPMSAKQWQTFSSAIDRWWAEKMNIVAEDVAIKGHELGKKTTEFRKRKKPYQNKSLYQVNFEQYKGNMPKTLKEAYEKYDFSNSEKNALNRQLSSISMYVKQTGNGIQEAIRQQIQKGIEEEKSPIEVASDLYWNVQKDENLVNEYTAETLRKNWNRIASTELAMVYEAGILAEHEAEAMESLKDPAKAQYFVFTGGTCPWCRAHQGVLVRLVPSSIVMDNGNDSLSAMGINDPNTDIAIWIGKNNIGFKENKNVHEWRIATPAHPYNVATLQPIDIKNEWFNPKTGDVEARQEKQKYVPKQVDYTQKIKDEKDWRKPTFIDSNLVRFNNNIYEAVNANEYNSKLEAWRKNSQLPIPVNRTSPSYKRIFEEAEKNR